MHRAIIFCFIGLENVQVLGVNWQIYWLKFRIIIYKINGVKGIFFGMDFGRGYLFFLVRQLAGVYDVTDQRKSLGAEISNFFFQTKKFKDLHKVGA